MLKAGRHSSSEPRLDYKSETFNSIFANWSAPRLANPDNVTYFCENWFVTAPRGPQADFVIEPLDPDSRTGLRVQVLEPPEMVRVWHKLPSEFLHPGRKRAIFKVRGETMGESAPQLDSVALFHGGAKNRRFARSLSGPVPLESSWRELIAKWEVDGTVDHESLISFRFSGRGIIEFGFCRLERESTQKKAWAVARGLAGKVMTKFRMSDRFAVGQSVAADGNQAGLAPATVVGGALAAKVRPAAPNEASSVAEAQGTSSTGDIGKPSGNVARKRLVPAEATRGREGVSAGNQAGLLQNADFGQWLGNRLEHWKVGGAKGVSLNRNAASLDEPFKNDSITLRFKGEVAGRAVSLGQSIGGLGADKPVDVVVVGRADVRTEVEVMLAQPGSGGSSSEVRGHFSLGPRWQFRKVRLRTPSNWRAKAGAKFLLKIAGEHSGSVHLGFVAAGMPGQDFLAGLESRELSSVASNAVANGTFDHWTGPLVQPLVARQVDITEEWSIVGKAPNPRVEARLTEIAPRGLRDGRDYAVVLGLAVHGNLEAGYVRMQATLDALQLAAGPVRTLSFFARTAHPSNGTGAMQRRGTIHDIFVAERHRLAPDSDEFHVKRLFTIKRNLRVRRIGERYVVELRGDHRAELAAKAAEMLRDPTRSLLLVFECSGTADVAVGDVRLGNEATAFEVRSISPKLIALEDPNIAVQLNLLKGLDHWRSEHPLRAATWESASLHPEEAKWMWPATSTTIDIVVCVYNAVGETLDCLESLRRHTTIPHTVTVVDDKSNHLTREQLRRYVHGKPWMRLIENEQNFGYTRSANIGLSSSSAEWVVLLNSDTIVTPGWLEGMFEVVKSRPGVAMVGPVSNAASWQSVPELHDVKGGWSANPLPEGWTVFQMARLVEELSLKMFPAATLLNGFCTLMRRDVVEEVGFLDEVAFPMGYGEENDLCLRVRNAGYSLAIADHVYVYHVKSASFGKSRRAELSKRGTAQLHAKHPDVDMKQVQRELAELTALIELRKRLRERLDPVGGRDADKVVVRRSQLEEAEGSTISRTTVMKAAATEHHTPG